MIQSRARIQTPDPHRCHHPKIDNMKLPQLRISQASELVRTVFASSRLYSFQGQGSVGKMSISSTMPIAKPALQLRTAGTGVILGISMLATSTAQWAAVPIVSPTFTNPDNGHEYLLVDFASWTDAEATAVTLGGHLVTINSAAENSWIYSTFNPLLPVLPVPGECAIVFLWIGLNDAQSEGNFVWSSGEPVTYTNWSPNQPDNARGLEDFTHIWTPGSTPNQPLGTWNDYENYPSGGPNAGYGVVEFGPGDAPDSLQISPFTLPTWDPSCVPEPEHYAVLGSLSLLGFGVWRRVRKSA